MDSKLPRFTRLPTGLLLQVRTSLIPGPRKWDSGHSVKPKNEDDEQRTFDRATVTQHHVTSVTPKGR